MKHSLNCPLCGNDYFNSFDFNVNPTNDCIYDITCPKGHKFKMRILSHHFQNLFENGLDALEDQYYIEAISSFASCYERFMEFFVRIVLKSWEVNSKTFDETWKKELKLSERQLGAFIIVYLKEFGQSPKLLSENSIKLRNNVIHKGYFPTMEECIKYGDNVLEVIRPIIKLLRDKELYEKELIKSLNDGQKINDEIRVSLFPYHLFAINRSFQKTDEQTVADFLLRRYENKNDEKYEEIIKEVRLLVKKRPKLPTNKYIINHAITRVLLKELYNFRYFNSGESDINILIKSYDWDEKDVNKIISHLESIEWITLYNVEGKYTLTGVSGNECEKLGFVEKEKTQKHKEERESLLKFIYKHKSQKINYKYSSVDLAKDYGRDIKDVGVYIADILELGYVTYYYKLTKEGEEIASKL